VALCAFDIGALLGRAGECVSRLADKRDRIGFKAKHAMSLQLESQRRQMVGHFLSVSAERLSLGARITRKIDLSSQKGVMLRN
jgi:hypothetical protein